MTVIRFLLLFAIAWFLWFTLRRWLLGVQTQAKKTKASREQRRPLAGGKVVKCSYCDVHLPEPEAVRQNAEWFCSNEHARLFLAKR